MVNRVLSAEKSRPSPSFPHHPQMNADSAHRIRQFLELLFRIRVGPQSCRPVFMTLWFSDGVVKLVWPQLISVDHPACLTSHSCISRSMQAEKSDGELRGYSMFNRGPWEGWNRWNKAYPPLEFVCCLSTTIPIFPFDYNGRYRRTYNTYGNGCVCFHWQFSEIQGC